MADTSVPEVTTESITWSIKFRLRPNIYEKMVVIGRKDFEKSSAQHLGGGGITRMFSLRATSGSSVQFMIRWDGAHHFKDGIVNVHKRWQRQIFCSWGLIRGPLGLVHGSRDWAWRIFAFITLINTILRMRWSIVLTNCVSESVIGFLSTLKIL